MVFEGASVAQIMVDSTCLLVLANARAREIFGLQPTDVGPFEDLELSWKPARLQPLVEEANTYTSTSTSCRFTTTAAASWG